MREVSPSVLSGPRAQGDRTTPLGGRARGINPHRSDGRGAGPDAGRRRRPAGDHPFGRRRSDAAAGGAARRGRFGRRRRRNDVEGHGHHGAVPGARPRFVSGAAAERRHGVLVGALDAGRRAGRHQDEGVGRGARRQGVRRRARRHADAGQDLPQRRHPRRRPRVRERHRAVDHRQARRLRFAHRVRDERPRLARDRLRRHGRRAHGGGDQDGLGQPAPGVFARRRRDRLHVLRAQQPRPLDRRPRAAGARGACRSSRA